MILKTSKSLEEKKKDRNLDIWQKKYIHAANTKHINKTNT